MPSHPRAALARLWCVSALVTALLAASTTRAARPDLPLTTTVSEGTWSPLPGIARTPRMFASAIYDPVRDRMVIFGGDEGSYPFNDVWTLSLSGTPTFEKLEPAGTPPCPRAYHTAVYDPIRDRMVVWGGANEGSSLCHELWELTFSGTPTWHLLSASGPEPAPRAGHVAIYDPRRDRMVIFGGGGSYDQGVWALSLSDLTWSEIALYPPIASLEQFGAAYDSLRDRMLIFGGIDGDLHFLNNTWAFSFEQDTWTAISYSGTPPSARKWPGVIYDPRGDRMLVFDGYAGGYLYPGATGQMEALQFGGAGDPEWAVVSAGESPSARVGVSLAYDSLRDRLLLYGGQDGEALRTDAWAMDLAPAPTWTRLVRADVPPLYRFGHTAIVQPQQDRMILFGGSNGYPNRFNDVWEMSPLDTYQWTRWTPDGTPPDARWYHSAVYDPIGDRMWVFGGYDGAAYFGDVWQLSLSDAPAWTPISPLGVGPGARASHAAVYDPDNHRMLVLGGFDGASHHNDVWALSFDGDPAWTQIAPSGDAPPPRSHHVAIFDPPRHRVVLFGGTSDSGPLNDVWALSLAGTPRWDPIAPSGTQPREREQAAAVYDAARDRMLIFGGMNNGQIGNDTWALSLSDTPTWSLIAADNTSFPQGVYGHSAVFDAARDRMIEIGGLMRNVWCVPGHHCDPYVPTAAAWGLTFSPDSPTPIAWSLVDVRTEGDHVDLVWYDAVGSGEAAAVYRREGGAAWSLVATLHADGSGYLKYEDRDVAPGQTYEYRLGITQDGRELFFGLATVTVPAAGSLQLIGANPNPATRDVSVQFYLPSDEAASVELIDITGRVALSRAVGGLGRGSHTLNLPESNHLAPGVYVLRLMQAGHVRRARAVIVH